MVCKLANISELPGCAFQRHGFLGLTSDLFFKLKKSPGRETQEFAFLKSFPDVFDYQAGLIITGLGRLLSIWSDILKTSSVRYAGQRDS